MDYQEEPHVMYMPLEEDSTMKNFPWYHPEVINVPDIENTLSTSEQAAQGKIYDLYHHNSPKHETGIMWLWYSSRK